MKNQDAIFLLNMQIEQAKMKLNTDIKVSDWNKEHLFIWHLNPGFYDLATYPGWLWDIIFEKGTFKYKE